MKINYFEEEFTDAENRKSHYNKHIVKNKEYQMSEDEYEREAERLAYTKVDYRNILGFVEETKSKSTGETVLRYCKYDKSKEFFTVYVIEDNKRKTITAYQMSLRDYEGFKAEHYFDEIYE